MRHPCRMRTGLPWDRLRRLVRFSRGAILGAVDLLRRALSPLTGMRERLGLVGVAGAGGVASPGPGSSGPRAGARRDRRAPAPDGGAPTPREPEADRPPERPASAPEAPAAGDLAAEAAAQPRHVALVVPPEPGAPRRATPGAPLAEPRDIPWSYGKDRVTAAAIDPNRLYVYWEVTDEAIERARAALGASGGDAWLNLRVYDTTGILFDGSNAHHHFDHGLGRSERQWFFHVGRPTSSAFVEIGLRARDGGFARIARSARIDFPRAEPAPWTDPEWMTVVASTGDAQRTGRGMPAGREGAPGQGGAGGDGALAAAAPQSFQPIPLWVIRDAAGHATWARELTGSGWERVEWSELRGGEGWFELAGRLEWEGPRVFSTWEAGPFPDPVEVREPTREEWEGRSTAFRVAGVTRVVHGPWQVVIRNLGAHVSRAVLGRWQIHRSWVAEGGREVRSAAARRAPTPGASELVAGASERAWASGSELRLSGASEVWRLGASELRLSGASERLYAGATETILRGASEQRLGGASEWRLRGASEQVRRGASERMLQGASERVVGGSEGRLGGSEKRLAEPAPSAAAGRGYPEPE